MRPLWKPIGLVLAAALVLSLFETVGLQIRNASLGRVMPWYDPLWRPLPHWLTLALVAPLAIAFAARFRIRPGQWHRLPLHLLAAIAFGILHIALGALAYGAILGAPRSLLGLVRSELAFDIGIEVLAYMVLAAGTHAWLWHDDARREREAAARAAADLAQARLRILRSQLQPHVLFNTLQAISTLALRHEDHAVVTAIARLSDVLRAALDEEGREEIRLARELEVTDSWLEIQRLRRGGALRIERDVDPAVLDACVPPLLLQPLVENALKHGLAGDRPGVVALTAHRRAGRLELTIADDGVGLGGGAEGTGLGVTRERLRTLYGADQSLTLDARPGGGTVVRVTLPERRDDAATRPDAADDAARAAAHDPAVTAHAARGPEVVPR